MPSLVSMSKFISGDNGLTAEAKQLAMDLSVAASKVPPLTHPAPSEPYPRATGHAADWLTVWCQGDVEGTRQAIWSGADVDQLDREGKSPLIHASRYRANSCACRVLSCGVRVCVSVTARRRWSSCCSRSELRAPDSPHTLRLRARLHILAARALSDINSA